MATQPAHDHHARVHAGTPASDHSHGSMDLRAHERTFGGFVRWMMWSAVAALAVLVFLALTNA